MVKEEVEKIPKIVGGKYQMMETIGQGTWAKVKRAIDLETGHEVAIKVFYHCTLQRKLKDGHAKLLSEYSLFSSLSHPNLLHYHDLLQDHDKVYLVLDFCQGGHLKPPYSSIAIKRILLGVLRGLEYLHAKDIAHHDIKPANILLDKDGSVKISDFGIAEQSKDGQCHSTYGTPAFQPPEVVNLSAPDTYDGYAADIWSCGLLAYYLLTNGKLLFNGETVYYVLKNIAECTKDPSLSDIADMGAREFVQSMLRVDPKKRLTAAQLLQSPWLYDNEASTSSRFFCCSIT